MNPVRRIFAVAAVACLVPALAAAQTETERVHKVVPLSPGGVLTLHNFSGQVRITGADVNQVTIDAVRRAKRERLEEIKLDIQASGDRVTIEANKRDEQRRSERDNVVETTFDIQVPRSIDLDVDVFSSDIQIQGVTGRQTLHTFSGEVRVTDAAERLKVKTFSGAMRLGMADAVSRLDVDLDTFSGDIDLRLPDGAVGGIDFDTFSGGLTGDVPMVLHSKRGRHVRASLGNADSGDTALRIKTFSGDARLHR